VILTGNTAGLTLGANIVSGDVTVSNNTVGATSSRPTTSSGLLACAGNSPPPTQRCRGDEH